MADTKEQLFKRINDQREIMTHGLERGLSKELSKRVEVKFKKLVLDILEHLLICDTARKLE